MVKYERDGMDGTGGLKRLNGSHEPGSDSSIHEFVLVKAGQETSGSLYSARIVIDVDSL